MKKRKDRPAPDGSGVSRRGFLKGASLSVAATGLLGSTTSPGGARLREIKVQKAGESHKISVTLNGQQVTPEVRTGWTLLETLRDKLDMTGTKLVCDGGNCGACTVILDGRPVNSCLVFAVDADGSEIQTIEGLAQDGRLHPVQQAFVEEDALQCGFCTPGMVMNCKSLLDRNPSPSRDEVAEALSGNICRCGTYVNIFRAMDRCSKAGGKGR